MKLLVAMLVAFVMPAPTHAGQGDEDAGGRRTVVDPSCCSYNLKDCAYSSNVADWCAMSSQNCRQCTGSWIDPTNRTTCIPLFGTNLWGQCNIVPDGSEGTVNDTCCGQSVCTRLDQWNKQCKVPQFCCSWDLATCGDDKWCNQNAQNCGSCSGFFIDPSTRRLCTARWAGCTSSSECCAGGVCLADASGRKVCDVLPVNGNTTVQPTLLPTIAPTILPTKTPTLPSATSPTLPPTKTPTFPSTKLPTLPPTTTPTRSPTKMPTLAPTKIPTRAPTTIPTRSPTTTPTRSPTTTPTRSPTTTPTRSPTTTPTRSPTTTPTRSPTTTPTRSPTTTSTRSPTTTPTRSPTTTPTRSPTTAPTLPQTKTPTLSPTNTPTRAPTDLPSVNPTPVPTVDITTPPSPPPTSTLTAVPTLPNVPTTSPPTTQPIAVVAPSCCSYNLKDCAYSSNVADWCAMSSQNCRQCTGSWIVPTNRNTCINLWGQCNIVPDGSEGTVNDTCCGQSVCTRIDQWNKQCKVPQFCCSWDLATCGDDKWCNQNAQNCGSCSGFFIDPNTRRSCTARWSGCTSSSECCAGGVCLADASGQQVCDVLPVNTQPTLSPTNLPTVVPTPLLSLSPTTPRPSPPPTTTPTRIPSLPTTESPTAQPTTSPTLLPTTSRPSPLPTFLPTGVPTVPTPPTTSRPTGIPSGSPTLLPTDLGPFPSGPYITVSSTRIIIPDPPSPASSARTKCPHFDTDILDWHAGSTWGSSGVPVPTNFADIQLPPNMRIVIRKPIEGIFGIITIPDTSELIFGENATGITLDARGMDVKGKLTAGSETCRLEMPVTITLYGSRPSNVVTVIPDKTYKGISVSGSISLHGKRYYRTWTRLAKTVAIGDRVMMVQNQVNWEPGQKIVLVTTAMKDSREWHQNEVLTVRGVVANPATGVGAAVYVNETIKYTHVANSGYQAEVGLLTRTIKIQGSATDSEPTDPDPLNCKFTDRWVYNDQARPCPNTELTGFGGHVMVHSNGTGYVEGVQLYRMGQTNVLGRYPMHFHLLGNCPTCYFRDSSVYRSFYRCVSVHGTNFLNVKENVAFDVTGYCYYLEDGVEHHNTISFNLAAHIHLLGPEPPSGDGQTTKLYNQSDILTLPADVTASGFYITNVQNNIIGNAASGGWSGFAFPNLPTPLGIHQNLLMRPSSALPLTIDGNTAHSTGWWWYHAGAFYFGGALYYVGGTLQYNPGRDFNFNNHGRDTCKTDLCSDGVCGGWCAEYDKLWIRMTNTKAFLAPSVGLNSWSGRMEIVGFEAHDVGLSLEALEAGFWIDNMLVVCRTGTTLALPTGASTSSMSGNGFTWYDTGQEHIITNSLFRNCGYRSQQYNQYDNTATRGCGTDINTGCAASSYVFGFLTHSDQFNPEVMQATKNITFDQCGRRFSLDNWGGFLSVSGRTQNWLDTDGTVSGLQVPALIGSGLAGAGLWWTVDDEVVHDPQGPLKFIKKTRERGVGALTFYFDYSQHSQVGKGICGNGNGNPCPALGYIKHLGKKFSLDNGLPITASADVAGPVGGFSWFLKLNAGAPTKLRVDTIEVVPETPMLLSIAYPTGTTFTITANAPTWCWPSAQYSCIEVFKPVDSIAAVRKSSGNTYYFSPQGLLTVRIIQTPKDYLGAPTWSLPQYNTTGQWGNGFAFPRFERGGVLLPVNSYGPWLDIVANCQASSSNSAYCSQLPPSLDPDVCPTGFNQTAYDKCCSITNSSKCSFADGSST